MKPPLRFPFTEISNTDLRTWRAPSQGWIWSGADKHFYLPKEAGGYDGSGADDNNLLLHFSAAFVGGPVNSGDGVYSRIPTDTSLDAQAIPLERVGVVEVKSGWSDGYPDRSCPFFISANQSHAQCV